MSAGKTVSLWTPDDVSAGDPAVQRHAAWVHGLGPLGRLAGALPGDPVQGCRESG